MAKTYKSENRIQQECYMWFHNTYPKLRGLLFAVPNGGARTAREGRLLKETGVVPGVSDMLLMYKGYTACLELKNQLGHQSSKQKSWQKLVESHGFRYYVVRDLTVFKDIVTRFIDHIELKGVRDD